MPNNQNKPITNKMIKKLLPIAKKIREAESDENMIINQNNKCECSELCHRSNPSGGCGFCASGMCPICKNAPSNKQCECYKNHGIAAGDICICCASKHARYTVRIKKSGEDSDLSKQLDELWYDFYKDELKSFISNTLTEQKKKMVEKLEGMKFEPDVVLGELEMSEISWNRAIDQAIKAIEDEL